jgi:hypothetical protein
LLVLPRPGDQKELRFHVHWESAPQAANSTAIFPLSRYSGRGVGGEGFRNKPAIAQTGLSRAPHPRPLSPKYRGEESKALPLAALGRYLP